MRLFRNIGLALFACSIAAQPMVAQDGVRLGLLYQAEYQPGFVVLPFASPAATQRLAAPIHAIIRQDLDFSDRFEMRQGTAGVTAGAPVNLALWKERGADWVLDGALTAGAAGGANLRLVLHDAVYGQVKAQGTFAIPPQGDPGFRMAVHAAADEVVRWATGQPGSAASRIAFVLQGRGGTKEIYTVDSDGENVQRLTNDGSLALSPAWSPDGARMAFTSYRTGIPILWERDLRTGRDRIISDRDGVNITPTYSPDGRTIVFATSAGGNTELATYDRERNCCLQQQTRGRRSDSLSPSFSPDGRQLTFVSNRLGEPHIYVMDLGGEARLISDYVYGTRGYNTSPEWSPRGGAVVYSSRVNGIPQLVLADLGRNTRRLLTNSGQNEDPSWASNGRHVVFSSRDREGGGLFVLDTVSGRVRPLLRGTGYGLPSWSPNLQRASPTATTTSGGH
ncbi:Tol-Pal system beta propeller repeat protein TolB [soil metagenome]